MSRLIVGHSVRTTTDLHTFSAVGRAISVVQTHVTLPAYGHTQRAMTEHFDANGLSVRSRNALFVYLPGDVLHLLHVEFAGQNGHVGKLCIELQGFDVRDVELRREMNLYSHLPAIHHHCYVAGNHRRDLGLFGRIDDGAHGG